MSRAETFGVCRLQTSRTDCDTTVHRHCFGLWMDIGGDCSHREVSVQRLLRKITIYDDNMDKESLPESIIMGPDTTCSPLFWDEDGVAIGEYDLFFIGDEEYSTSSLIGLKEWFMKADKYDPYTDITKFTTEGMEDWINQGYEYAKQLRSMIPNIVGLYYGYWHQFGDGRWRWCKAYISPK